MTIYLVSELYPVDERDTSITHAIRYFAEAWEAEVIVFRPLQIRLASLKRLPAYRKQILASPGTLGSRPVVFFSLLKIPFLRSYLFRIRNRRNYPAPSIIVGHSLIGNYVAHRLSRAYRVPFSAGLHNYDIFNLYKEKRRYEHILQQSSLIACRSQNILKMLNEYTGDRFAPKCFVANSGIEEDLVEEASLFIAKARDMTTRPVRFITVARLEASKNIDINIRVLEGLEQDFSYTIIGDGPDRGKLQSQIERSPVSGRISILGWKDRSEVMAELKQADIFIMVSAPETFGLAYLEAMAKGCIVVGAHGWGIDGIITHGRNGCLAEPRDIPGLSQVIRQLLSLPPEKREQVALASRASVLELTLAKAAGSYLAKLKQVLQT